jgi:hypothetical protein
MLDGKFRPIGNAGEMQTCDGNCNWQWWKVSTGMERYVDEQNYEGIKKMLLEIFQK